MGSQGRENISECKKLEAPIAERARTASQVCWKPYFLQIQW